MKLIAEQEAAAMPSRLLHDAATRAQELAAKGLSSASRKALDSDWRNFTSWCDAACLSPLPAAPETIGLFIAAHSDLLTVATLRRRLATISALHRMAGLHLDTRHPAIRSVLRGLIREKGVAQRQAEAATLPILLRMVEACGDDLLGLRDRALLLFGFASALRRAELAALCVADLRINDEGIVVTVRRSKTDQSAAGQIVAVARTRSETCPVAAVESWMQAAGVQGGPIFRSINRAGRIGPTMSDRAVSRAVQRRSRLAGLEAARFSAHSLRAGFASSAAQAGVEERVIAEQTRHRSSAVLRRYIRAGRLFSRNLSQELGL